MPFRGEIHHFLFGNLASYGTMGGGCRSHYPEGESSFTLYEDDGITYNYLEGNAAVSEITCRATGKTVTLTIAPRAGSYEGMPETRSFDICLHSDTAPTQVLLNGKRPVNPDGSPCWHYGENMQRVRLTATEDPHRKESVVILCSYDW